MPNLHAMHPILHTLQADCADAATVVGMVLQCPDRLTRLKPPLLLQLRRMQPTLECVIDWLGAVEGDPPVEGG